MAFVAPTLQARVGARRSILVALAVLALASLLRLFVWTGWQMVATAALLGLGAAVVQAMFPGIIKRHFPARVGVVMGLYSAMLMGGKREDRRPWLWLTLAMQITGFLALVLRPEVAPFLWVAILGAGLGGCFALSMIVALEHLPAPAEAGALSALMQGGGFLLAALPPWIVAILHNLTGSFTAGWMLHLCCAVVVAGLYWRMAPAGYARAMGRPFRTMTTMECGPCLSTSLGIQTVNPGRSSQC